MSEPTTMGAYLRSTRRRRRISIEKAAEDTRIRSDFLMRMESDEFDFLAPTYVRGFLRSYTRYLRVPEEPLLEEFDRRFGRRAETQQLAGLERQSRRDLLPARRKMNSWGVASVMAAAVLLLLAAIGLTQGDDDGTRPSRIAGAIFDEQPTPDAAETSGATPQPSPEATVAFAEGIELEVLASNGDCWVEIYADGKQLYYQVLPEGGSETFSADEKMFVRLGFPEGVELVLNGRDLGSPGGTDPIELTFPDDIEAL